MSLPTTSFSFAEDEAWCFEKEIALAVSKGCFFCFTKSLSLPRPSGSGDR